MRLKVKIMGILNVTPDSFYDGGRYSGRDSAVERALQMAADGADIIDVGGESTRPGAAAVPLSEELERVIPVIESLKGRLDVPLSIDTTKPAVADAALRAGAVIVNDISGFTFDGAMPEVIARHGAFAVIGHIRGEPGNMQNNPVYENLIEEIVLFLENASVLAIEAGVKKERIIIDPGIGFGKSLKDNYRIINNISRFKRAGYPVLIGLSRKSLIGKVNGNTADRLPATIALNSVAVRNGADILRVHDVEAHNLALKCLGMLEKVS